MLAVRRVDLGPGDAGTAGRHQSPGHDHDDAAPAGGSRAHSRRGDHRPDDRLDLRQPGPFAAASFSRRSSACMKIPSWAGRRSTPSFSRRPTASGSPASTRRAMSRSTPSTTRHTSSAARSTPARRGTRRRCSSRSGPIPTSDRQAGDGVRRLPRARRGEPEERPRHQGAGRLSCRVAVASTRSASTRPRRPGRRSARRPTPEYERVFGSRIIARWPQHLVLDGLDTIELCSIPAT